MKIRTVSGNQVFLLPSDAILKVSAVVACSVQLGLSRDYAGYYTIKKTESSANAVTILPASGEKIDGADSVTLTTENEYKTLAPAEGGWTVVDSYTVTPSYTSPVLTTPVIADGDKRITLTSANQTHAAPVLTIPNIGDAADEIITKDVTQTMTNKTLTAPTVTNPALSLKEGTPVNAVAAKVEIAAAVTALLNVEGDEVEFEGSSFTYKASEPGATEFSNVAGLAALLGAIAGWDAADDAGKITITATTKGMASNNKNAVLTIYSTKTASGAEEDKATCTIPAADLAQLAVGDSVTFDSVEYIKAAANDTDEQEWADTAGLISCIDVSADWAATASSSDVVITAAENGAASNDKEVYVIVRRTTASGVDGTVGAKYQVLADATNIYIASAANTVADTNWKKITLASL